ncbi:MAG TPA: hypothetical protein VKQ72_13140 [Aggregatilineales bacterium]|nr:hypothetical protein [Aggregatilineales bacterium]
MANQDEPKAKGEGSAEKESPLAGFIDHQRKAYQEAAQALSAFLPPDVKTHGRAARDEYVKSFKVLIEGMAKVVNQEMNRAKSSSSTGDTGPTTTGKSKVKVDVS